MTLPAIRVEHLSKRYQLGLTHAGSIRELAARWTGRLLRRNGPESRERRAESREQNAEISSPSALRPPLSAPGSPLPALRSPPSAPAADFWALRDVSFEVQPGEVVGIIGRNGAGKSTLLKILSRITSPTEGRVEINGRVASLLEVGTGFHPELTGRENVFLNGAILGMTKAEIRKKFDEIVAFAEIDQFIDTPVKRYSSGMYVRLAFAVAAHLEPEILIVDEVLAVGDTEFQKKCLGTMGEVARSGRTVLFVSHNMAAVAGLCKRVIVLKNGMVWDDGPPTTITRYLESLSTEARASLRNGRTVENSKHIWFSGVWFENARGDEISTAIAGDIVTVCLEYQCRDAHTHGVTFTLTIYDSYQNGLLCCDTRYTGSSGLVAGIPRNGVIKCRIPRLPLSSGRYRVNVAIWRDGKIEDHIVGAAQVTVEDGDYYGTGRTMPPGWVPILVDHTWEVRPIAHHTADGAVC